MQLPFPAHTGTGSYLFVSYAHVNADQVYPEIGWLNEAGINIWYDEGITPGSRWSEELAAAIEGCALFLVFLTKESVQSENCLNEIDFALRRKRPFLAIELEPVSLPAGIELNIGNRQSILKYRFSEDHYRARLLETIRQVEHGKGSLAAARATTSATRGGGHYAPESGAESTPVTDRLKNNPIRTTVAAVLLIAMIASIIYLWSPASGNADPTSIAVLPLQNLSGDPSIDYLADGLADELIALLGAIEGLGVSSRTSSFYYKGRTSEMGDIRTRLGVDNAIEGSIRPEQQHLVIQMALFRTDTGRQIWSQRFESTLDTISTLPAQIASAIARQLVPDTQQTPSDLDEGAEIAAAAYQAYLKGLDYLSRPPTPEVLNAARLFFEQAVAEQPDFAKGHAALCETHLATYRMARTDDVESQYDLARAHCERAVQLDGTLAAGHKSLAVLHLAAGRFPDALKEIRLANTLLPNNAAIHHELGKILAELDEPVRAEAMLRRAIELDQGFWGGYADLGDFLYLRGRYEEALAQFNKVHELTPSNGLALVSIGATQYMIGDTAAAEVVWRQAVAEFPGSESRAFWQAAHWLGISAFFRGCYEEAAYWQTEALRVSPNDHRLIGNLAKACELQNQQPGGGIDPVSRALYERATALADMELDLNPNDWESIGSKALYMARAESTEHSRQLIDQMLALQPDNPDALEIALQYTHRTADTVAESELRARLVEANFPMRLLEIDPFVGVPAVCAQQTVATERLICTAETVIPALAP